MFGDQQNRTTCQKHETHIGTCTCLFLSYLDACVLAAKVDHLVYVRVAQGEDVAHIMAGLYEVGALQRLGIPHLCSCEKSVDSHKSQFIQVLTRTVPSPELLNRYCSSSDRVRPSTLPLWPLRTVTKVKV